MSNGIRSLNGGGVDPPRWERPDTVKGLERKRMMDDLSQHFGVDTTNVSQEGINRWFQSDDYGDILEVASQLREGSSEPGVTPTVRTRRGRFKVDNPVPLVETYSKFHAEAGSYAASKDKIKLNILLSMLGQHAREERPDRYQPEFTKAAWEETPAESLRNTLLHELGHAVPASRWPLPEKEDERTADDLAAVWGALENAPPGASKEDILRAAQKIYWDHSNFYTAERAREQDALTGIGSYEDPFAVDPDFIEKMRVTQSREMEPELERFLAIKRYEDHPLNRGLLEKFMQWRGLERFIDRTKQGIGSLFGGRDNQ